ncbi:MAG TPA: calcium/sodium antiporter [Salinimicrobium sp.]|nr:calcium/sodium antiporter [Salinimicrobium sp.]
MLDFIFLIGGIALIIFSANWLVNGASALAKKYGVSDLVIGLTIVAFGTSAPELTVNVFAALEGSTDIAIGNVLGSNIANILLIVGVSAVIFPLTIKRNTTWKEIPLSLLAAIVLGFLANDVVIDGADESLLSRIDGLVLICFFAIFMFYTADMAKNSPEILLDDEIVPKPIWKCLLLIVGGLLGLYFGGDFMVDAAVNIANRFGMSEKLIGVTIIALGTSVPELATSVVAAMKKNTDIAIGNIVGSNIFNIFFILGLTSIIEPLPFAANMNFDILWVIFASLVLFLSTLLFGKGRVGRKEGIIFIVFYVAYILISIFR